MASKNPHPTQNANPIQARLMIREPGENDRAVPLSKPILTLGRLADNDLVFSSSHVSSLHGRFEFHAGQWMYTDLDSTNGSSINGARVRTAALNDGDIVAVGDLKGTPILLAYQEIKQQAVKGIMGTVHIGTRQLGLEQVQIGRDASCGLRLDSPIVSRKHARLIHTPQGHILTDLNSVNGTFINGERLVRPLLLHEGDLVQIGPFSLIYGPEGLQQYSSAKGVQLDGINLVREVGRGDGKKRILKNVDISI
ncbi:MAG: FHA domain-containing protein, partial [Anaerolineales bacterium]|nr:FHA domain-containing protein [Anaerolineales bacterium]